MLSRGNGISDHVGLVLCDSVVVAAVLLSVSLKAEIRMAIASLRL